MKLTELFNEQDREIFREIKELSKKIKYRHRIIANAEWNSLLKLGLPTEGRVAYSDFKKGPCVVCRGYPVVKKRVCQECIDFWEAYKSKRLLWQKRTVDASNNTSL